LILADAGERPGIRRDLEALAERIPKLAPEIDVVVAGGRHREQRKLLLRALRPSLAVGFGKIRSRRFPAGEIFHCPQIPKYVEMERLRAAGVPVPDWLVLTPGVALDPAIWGPYVVVKPDAGYRGAEVRIRRTGRVRYEPPESFPAEHPARKGPMLAQRFIYTGPWAVGYRVTTFFGRALFCWRVEQSHEKRRLESRFDFGGSPDSGGGGIQIIAPSKTSSYTLVDDKDVLELAERAHRLAFPDYPYLGVDLLRDAETGELWVIEVNSGGSIWHFSTRMGVDMQKAHGMDFYAQFGALDRAAERLIELTRARARRAPLGRKAEQYRAL
jgi:hypothetical protein